MNLNLSKPRKRFYVIGAILALLTSSLAFANDEKGSCENNASVAGIVMQMKSSNLSYEDAMALAAEALDTMGQRKVDLLEQYIDVAYSLPNVETPEEQEEQRADFIEARYSDCLINR